MAIAMITTLFVPIAMAADSTSQGTIAVGSASITSDPDTIEVPITLSGFATTDMIDTVDFKLTYDASVFSVVTESAIKIDSRFTSNVISLGSGYVGIHAGTASSSSAISIPENGEVEVCKVTFNRLNKTKGGTIGIEKITTNGVTLNYAALTPETEYENVTPVSGTISVTLTQEQEFQAMLLEAMDLDKSSRQAFVNNVLKPIDAEITSTGAISVDTIKNLVPAVKGLMTATQNEYFTDAKIITALSKYVDYSTSFASRRDDLYKIIEDGLFALSNDDQVTIAKFPTIVSSVNLAVTGNSSDNKGIQLLLTILKTMNIYKTTESAIAIDSATNSKLLDVNTSIVNPLYITKVNNQIPSFITLYNRLNNPPAGLTYPQDASPFDMFVMYAMYKVNNASTDATTNYTEVAALKAYLKTLGLYQGNGGAPDILYGDVDNDKVITIDDALYIAKHAGKLSFITDEVSLLAADVDGDNEITIDDALYVAKYVGKLITELPRKK